MLAVLAAPLRFRVIRVLVAAAMIAGLLALASWVIADRWVDDEPATTLAFLALFGTTVVAVVVLWRGAVAGRRRRERTLDGLLALSPAEFETAVARMMRRSGFRDVSVVGGAGDLAADIVARSRDGGHVVVQCKRKAPGHRVGSAEMQMFIGMAHVHHGAARGMYVTTSSFTAPAVELADEHEILLVDGVALADIACGRRRIDGAQRAA